jgi:hypothetical protein
MDVSQSGGVTTVRIDVEVGQQQKIYLISDAHFDSVFCDRDLFKRHLERALKDKAFILDGGDFFDAMQGRFDPRRSMDELRPEYRRDDYYDFVVRDAAEYLEPFAPSMILMAPGNHELSILKNANTYLTDRLVAELRRRGAPVVTGGFKGWVRVLWRYRNGNDGGSFLIRYSHSGGGHSAPVTRGVIDTNRQAVYLPDAHVVWNGHNHEGWIVPIARERISGKGSVFSDIAWFIRTPGYKAEYESSDIGFAAQRATGPRPRGCAVITLEYTKKGTMSSHIEPLFEAGS